MRVSEREWSGEASSAVRVQGVDVHIRDTRPDSPPELPLLLALHGIPESGESWRDVANCLGSQLRILMPDLPGFGRSEKPRDFDYSLPNQAGVVEELLDRVAPESAVHLVVHDIGGAVGLIWATQLAKRPPASITILNTTLFPRYFRPPIGAIAAQVPLVGQRAVSASMRSERLFKRQFRTACARPIEESRLEQAYAPYREPAARDAAAATWGSYLRSASTIDRTRRALRSLRVPTTIAFGAEDRFCTPSSARAFADAIPGSRLELLENVGHFTPIEAPEEVSAAIMGSISAASDS